MDSSLPPTMLYSRSTAQAATPAQPRAPGRSSSLPRVALSIEPTSGSPNAGAKTAVTGRKTSRRSNHVIT
eukprot:6859791-Prymnesium_polylepis.1